MFSGNFANNVIAPTAAGQPSIISAPVLLGVHIILLNPAFFDACFALIQLAIGASILWKRSTKVGLIASVIWGVAVWVGGEGLAGMASGHASLLMGAPGAALIYVILALAVMPPRSKDTTHNSPAYWLTFVWAIFWIGGAIYQLLPGQDSVAGLGSMISDMGSGAPHWLATLDANVGSFLNGLATPTTSMTGMHMTASQMAQMPTQQGSGYWFVLLIAVLEFLIGLGVFYTGMIRKIAIGIGIALSLVFWVVGQSLGTYYTGLATDPNSGPLFTLLGFAILGCTDLDEKLAKIMKRIEYTLVGKPS
jgi:hypothetical protein